MPNITVDRNRLFALAEMTRLYEIVYHLHGYLEGEHFDLIRQQIVDDAIASGVKGRIVPLVCIPQYSQRRGSKVYRLAR